MLYKDYNKVNINIKEFKKLLPATKHTKLQWNSDEGKSTKTYQVKKIIQAA